MRVPIHQPESEMSQTNQSEQAQRAARAAMAEQMAAKAAVHSTLGHNGRPRAKYPAYNAIIVIGILLTAVATLAALIWRAG